MSDLVNDPGESQRRWVRRLMRLQIARELTPSRLSGWLTRPQPPGIHWRRVTNRESKVEIVR